VLDSAEVSLSATGARPPETHFLMTIACDSASGTRHHRRYARFPKRFDVAVWIAIERVGT
jgi:hypothetical protein